MIGIAYGGNSLEHDVSIMSAEGFLSEIDARAFYLSKDGSWYENDELIVDILKEFKSCDVIFPLFHGGYGEDGTFQGYLEFNDITYIGPKVVDSVVCMDKDLSKRILESHGIATTPFTTLYSLDEIDSFIPPKECVVKPTSLGSTFGVMKVKGDFRECVQKAFSMSSKVIVEDLIKGREIWVSVLQDGNELITSSPCELVPNDEFHTYETKYSSKGATYHLPADVKNPECFQQLAKRAFKVLSCQGMARVDFFLKDNGDILIQEINTIPGFTPTSLFPKALINDGMSYKNIVESLVSTALKSKSTQDFSSNLSTAKKRVLV